MKKVLFTATVDSHILHFHIPYLKMFKENGYEVHVATNGDEKIPYCDIKHKVCFERNPFKINNLRAIKVLKKIIDKEKFEIVHCHTPMGSVVTRIAAIKARKNGTRVIYTAHGFHFYKGAPILNWCLFYPIEKWLSKYTDTLITINKEDYELAKKKLKKCKDIKYVPGVGIDKEKFNFEMTQKEKNELRKSLGLSEYDYVIIYVAELIKRKNQSMAIKVIKKLVPEYPNIKLLLVGEDSYNGKYQALVKKLNLESNVIFAGYRKDVPKLMKISNLAISTAKQEGLPVNIIEAIACDLPLIVTDCRGNRDLVDSKHVVQIDNVNQMVKKIKHQINEKSNCFKKNNFKMYELKEITRIMEGIYIDEKNKNYIKE